MSKYFVVHDKNMACALRLITGQAYYVFDHVDGGKAYSFIRTAAIEKAYIDLGLLIQEARK